MRTASSLKLTLLLPLLAMLLTACSRDVHVFNSTVDQPTNVTIYDPMAKQALWTREIPVGQSLRLDFDRAGESGLREFITTNKSMPATQMKWKMYRTDGWTRPLGSESVKLPGTPVRIDVSYRPSPEYPSGTSSAPSASPPSMQGK